MTTEVHLPPIDKQQQFLDARRLGIGGSDSGSLFPEDSKYGCDVKLFFDKSGVKPDYPRTQAEDNILKRGHIWESVVALYFQEWATDKGAGLRIRRQGPRVSRDYPFMAVNMDRQIINTSTEELKMLWPDSPDIQAMEGDCGPGYLECKSANEWMFKAMMKEGVHHDYILQVNHGLVVTGYKWGVFAVLEPASGNFVTFPYTFKPNLAAEQIRRAEQFWADLQAGVMPEVKVNDRRCKTCQWRRTCPRSKDLMALADKEFAVEGYTIDDSLAELVDDYKLAREIVDQKQETVDTIKARLQEAVGERQKIEVPSAGARISWAPTKPPMRWDSKALEGTVKELEKQLPEVAAKVASCRRAGEPSRPFKVVFE